MSDNTPQPTNDADHERRPSWSFMQYLAVYFVIAALTYAVTRYAAILALLFLAACIWSTFSKKEYQRMKKTYPNYPRGDYILNSLIFEIIVPWAIMLILAGLAYIFSA